MCVGLCVYCMCVCACVLGCIQGCFFFGCGDVSTVAAVAPDAPLSSFPVQTQNQHQATVQRDRALANAPPSAAGGAGAAPVAAAAASGSE